MDSFAARRTHRIPVRQLMPKMIKTTLLATLPWCIRVAALIRRLALQHRLVLHRAPATVLHSDAIGSHRVLAHDLHHALLPIVLLLLCLGLAPLLSLALASLELVDFTSVGKSDR